MADTKITALTALTGADPANDVIPIVDVSDTTMAASGTTKKISVNNILGASGTATLASATITGAASAAGLSVTGSTIPTNGVYLPSANNLGFAYNSTLGMTLNSTGLGVGASPDTGFALTVKSSRALARLESTTGTQDSYYQLKNTGGTLTYGIDNNTGVNQTGTGYAGYIWHSGAYPLIFATNNTERLRIDSSGNVGIGVTPSAWASYKALQVGSIGSLSSATGATIVGNNWFFDGASKYITTAASTIYEQGAGTHVWFNAPSGTAGNAITFTQAMTLDASGNLLIGKTATNYLTVGCELKPNGAVQSTQSGSTNANSCWDTYSTGAGAYRFYVGMAGTVFATNTTISAISDARFKENVQDIDVGLGAILALKPRKFDWKDGKGKNIKGDRGFIAQEFETVFPNLIDEWKENAPEGEAPYKSVRQDLIPVLVKAIQELTARVQTLETR